MLATTSLPRRYPGLKPFERNQSPLFRGRSEDIQRLTNLIVRERLVVLFSKSGIGKTSLMQAGVAPRLEEQGFVPIFLRSDKTDRPLSATTAQSLQNNPAVGGMDDKDPMEGVPLTLWEQMKRLQFDLDGLPGVPVLVLDQFEEVFTLAHADASRHEFLEQIADLVNESIPDPVHDRLMFLAKDAPLEQSLSSDLMQWWEKQPELRIVISIRSDFLHLLDDISKIIPSILRNRYQLQPLNRKQAQEAIESPAIAPGIFASNPFSFTPEAIKVIINYLAGRETSAEIQTSDEASLIKKQDEIESFNLQILCQYVEAKIIKEQKEAGFIVEPPFYGNKEGLESEIRNFYTKQLQNLPEAYTKMTGELVADPKAFVLTAQKLIEEDLITPAGRRCSVVDDTLTERWKVNTAFLDTLVESRLLRKELRLDDFYFEITHDTLLPAVLESREYRRTREKSDTEKELLTNELREEALKRKKMENELELTKRQRRLARMVGLLSLGMLTLSIGFGIWFTRLWALSVEQEFKIAEENCRNEQFDAARAGYAALADNDFKNRLLGGDINAKAKDAVRFEALYDQTLQELAHGDSLFFLTTGEDYAGALVAYRRAADSLKLYKDINYQWKDAKGNSWWRVYPTRIEERQAALLLRINSTQKTLITQFIVRQREAEAFKEAGMWGQQKRNLIAMQKLLPVHPDDVSKLHSKLGLSGISPREYVEEELRQCQKHL